MHKFYDVKERKVVEAKVISKTIYGTKEKPRYALCAKTEDGRNLITFCNKETFDKYDVKVNKKGSKK